MVSGGKLAIFALSAERRLMQGRLVVVHHLYRDAVELPSVEAQLFANC